MDIMGGTIIRQMGMCLAIPINENILSCKSDTE